MFEIIVILKTSYDTDDEYETYEGDVDDADDADGGVNDANLYIIGAVCL